MKEARHERPVVYDSIDMNGSGKANVKRQKANQWLSGAEGGSVKGHKGALGGDGNVLSDGCIIL